MWHLSADGSPPISFVTPLSTRAGPGFHSAVVPGVEGFVSRGLKRHQCLHMVGILGFVMGSVPRSLNLRLLTTGADRGVLFHPDPLAV